MSALFDFYNATHGENWNWRPESPALGYVWNFIGDPNPCKDNWQGLICKYVAPYNHITSITLDAYNLTGSIPESIGNLAYLRVIEIAVSSLSGPLPHSIGNLTSLQALYISGGLLGGQLPSSMGDLSSLSQMDLQLNQLSGTIPASFGKLKSLQTLNLAQNNLRGTIPPELGLLTTLPSLLLYANRLSGTIPAALGNMTQLIDLYLEVNQLSGPIPASLSNLTRLRNLDLSNNALTGAVPVEMYSLNQVRNFYLHTNQLSGTIPDAIANLTSLQVLELSSNRFNGSIPASLGALQDLQYIQLDSNHLTGSIPSSLYALTGLQRLDLDTNYFTGHVPIRLDKWPYMLLFDVSSNYLTGTVSSSVGDMSVVQYLAFSDNILSGSVPPQLSTLRNLNVLHLQDNQFSGPLTDIFNASVQIALSAVEVSNNAFTGHLPEQLFLLPALTSVIAVSNCFYGSIPDVICDAVMLNSLVLDGLSAAPACRSNLLGASSSYVLKRTVTGTIPACLFTLPVLSTLHLSGNGLTGSFHDIKEVSASLVDVILSHNRLTGNIPAYLQDRRWYNLDLSYNRLSGSLLSSIESLPINVSYLQKYGSTFYHASSNNVTVNPALYLQNNRISGAVPSNVLPLVNVSILGSNLFACRFKDTDLPQHDQGIHRYECGSTRFDVTYYLWLAVLAASVGLAAALYYFKINWYAQTQSLKEAYVRTFNAYNRQGVNLKARLTTFGHLLSIIRRVSLQAAIFVCVFLLPVYLITSYYFSTYTHVYAWAASSAFLSGYEVICVVLPLLIILVGGIAYSLSLNSMPNKSVEKPSEMSQPSKLQLVAIYALYALINIIAVVGVNVAYVYIAIYQSSDLLVFAQIMLSFFKLIWNNIVSRVLLRGIISLIVTDATPEFARLGETQFASLQIVIALVNSVAIPCLVVAVVSPSCFYNVFVSPPQVKSYYTYEYCQVYSESGACTVPVTKIGGTSYTPPFTYSYQCSSSLITYYAPPVVSICIISTFFTPLLQAVLAYVCARPETTASRTPFHKLIVLVTPLILKPPPAEPDNNTIYLRANQMLVIHIYYLGMLLTFGAMFPPLAVTLALTIVVSGYVSKVKAGRFLLLAAERNLPQYADILDAECQGVGSVDVLERAKWMLITVSYWFYTLFLFDTLGDAMGFKQAYWLLIFMPVVPLAIFIVYHVMCHFFVKNGTAGDNFGGTEAKPVDCIELGPVPERKAADVVSPELKVSKDASPVETYNILQTNNSLE